MALRLSTGAHRQPNTETTEPANVNASSNGRTIHAMVHDSTCAIKSQNATENDLAADNLGRIRVSRRSLRRRRNYRGRGTGSQEGGCVLADVMSQISKLVLSSNRITSTAFLVSFAHIQSLDLERNQLTSIADLPLMANLRDLHIEFNQLDNLDETVNVLQAQTPRLSGLNMAGNPFWPRGIGEPLRQYRRQIAQRLPELTSLDHAIISIAEKNGADFVNDVNKDATAHFSLLLHYYQREVDVFVPDDVNDLILYWTGRRGAVVGASVLLDAELLRSKFNRELGLRKKDYFTSIHHLDMEHVWISHGDLKLTRREFVCNLITVLDTQIPPKLRKYTSVQRMYGKLDPNVYG